MVVAAGEEVRLLLAVVWCTALAEAACSTTHFPAEHAADTEADMVECTGYIAGSLEGVGRGVAAGMGSEQAGTRQE